MIPDRPTRNIPNMFRTSTPCRSCLRRLRSELHCLGPARYLLWRDDDERSATYSRRVKDCPGCGAALPVAPPDGLRWDGLSPWGTP